MHPGRRHRVPSGNYAEAEPLSKRSLASVEKALGQEHPHVATALGTAVCSKTQYCCLNSTGNKVDKPPDDGERLAAS